MILNEAQIKSIILDNPQRKLVLKGVEYSKKLRRHMYGEKLENEIKAVGNFEAPSLRELRAKYARSNKDLFTRIARPIDKVFSAKGGAIYYNLPEDKAKVARQLVMDVKSGYSAKEWVEKFWLPHFLDDPNGMVFIEIATPTQVALLRSRGKSIAFPTYKPITSVYDYLPSGASVEYVVFNLSREEKIAQGIAEEKQVFRVVDDSMDYIVERDGQDVRIMTELTLQNFFMQVPAILNSSFPDPGNENHMLSLFEPIIELADHFLLKGSIKVTHDFLHGFPKYWEYADGCNDCGGSGFKHGEPCKICRGTGKSLMTKVSDAKLLNHPQSKDDPMIAPNVAGYVSPDRTFWEIATHDLQLLEDLMNYTLWGSNPMPRTKGMQTDETGGQKTATEIMTDVKPQSDRLYPISEAAAKRHKFILDAIVQVNINQSYPGSSVNYGKRYMLEGPDVLWEKYSKARIEGAAVSVLDDLLQEYYEAKYDSDPVKLAIQTKLMRVEPFIHLTAEKVKALSPAEEDYKAKLYFGEWLSTLNEAMILSFSEEELRSQLIEAAKAKQLPEPEKENQAA